MDTTRIPRNLIFQQARRRSETGHPVNPPPVIDDLHRHIGDSLTSVVFIRQQTCSPRRNRQDQSRRIRRGPKGHQRPPDRGRFLPNLTCVVTTRDVIYALNRLGNTLYGF
ncbi:hypothetical protein ANOM_006333 [Aspergillus nomiae NRRL 13137]|uniref:Uncharacterized protein n=1 Tax=Aspergillus nomiae NRRL (strain ATCC 15546 / NRRL 13137 / CBS 260.88 / M93) TaxID=1509407 RepID=A0A0L1J1Q4_ASPN3|nr:uncharacterized protein ANOM_006333 [Aspergillus nomiae NRRL 13137]KNG85348.1 hypothetical protein ANOM_006333 [Aspergillus nomiae NRRL 13137]